MRIQDNYPNGKVLWFNDYYTDGNIMIFSAGNFNGLYEYSIENKELFFLGKFKNEHTLRKQLYGKVHKFENKLVFTPLSANSIAIYDLNSKTFESIILPVPQVPSGYECKFLNSVIFDDNIFMFPGYGAYIVEYNIRNKKLKIHTDWYKECINRWDKKSHLLFHFDSVNVDNTIYLPSAQHNGVFKYCLYDNTYDFIEILYSCKKIDTLAYDGGHLWCTTDNGKLLVANLEGEIIREIDISAHYGETGGFYHSIYNKGYLWLFSSQKNTVLKFNCSNYEKEIEIIRYCEIEKKYTNYEYHTVNFIEKKDDLIVFMCRADRALKSISGKTIVNYLNNIIDTTGYSEKNVDKIELYSDYVENIETINNFLHENRKIILHEETPFDETLKYILSALEKYEEKKISTKNNTSIGRDIYIISKQ